MNTQHLIRLAASLCVVVIALSWNGADSSASASSQNLATEIVMDRATYPAIEGRGSYPEGWTTVAINRTGDLSSPLTVAYTTRNGTATDTNDYYATSGEFPWPAGQNQVSVNIQLRNDYVYEPDETFEFVITGVTGPGATLGTPAASEIIIVDDEYPPAVFPVGRPVQEAEAGKTSTAYAYIRLTNASSTQTISVSYSTSDGTAVAGNDYVPVSGTVTFVPGEDDKRIPITIIGDSDNTEGRETFVLNLSNSVNAPIGLSSSSVTIVNHLPLRPQQDFDGDTVADRTNYSTSLGTWYWTTASTVPSVSWGVSSDVIVPADYTGDGRTDIAIWRASTGTWWVLQSDDSSHYAIKFGLDGDVPIPADYDGDGRADIAIFRPSTGTWYIMRSGSGDVFITTFGRTGDRPVPADYDGDWKADLGVFRPNEGTSSEWWIQNSGSGAVSVTRFGLQDDRAVPADYTGDGKADISVWRATNRWWYTLRSEDSAVEYISVGGPFSIPAPGDYNGVGGFERSTYDNNAQARLWEVVYAFNNREYTGAGPGDIPTAAVYVR